MNTRDFFAGLAMHAILSRNNRQLSHEAIHGFFESVADESFDIATEMMNARARAGTSEALLEDPIATAIQEATRDIGIDLNNLMEAIDEADGDAN